MARPRTTHDEKVEEVEADLETERTAVAEKEAEILVIEEHGAEAILNDVEAPDKPEQQEAPEGFDPADEHGAEANYWEGDYTGGVPPTELPGETVPTVTAVNPSTITLGPPADETLTITGTGFTGASQVSVGVSTYVSETEMTTLITADSQPNATTLAVSVDGSNSIDVTVA